MSLTPDPNLQHTRQLIACILCVSEIDKQLNSTQLDNLKAAFL